MLIIISQAGFLQVLKCRKSAFAVLENKNIATKVGCLL